MQIQQPVLLQPPEQRRSACKHGRQKSMEQDGAIRRIGVARPCRNGDHTEAQRLALDSIQCAAVLNPFVLIWSGPDTLVIWSGVLLAGASSSLA